MPPYSPPEGALLAIVEDIPTRAMRKLLADHGALIKHITEQCHCEYIWIDRSYNIAEIYAYNESALWNAHDWIQRVANRWGS